MTTPAGELLVKAVATAVVGAVLETRRDAASQAWLLAATEVERLACPACKCRACDDGTCRVHDQPRRHTTCERALRLARKFRVRADAATEAAPRTRESRVEEENHGRSDT